MPNVSVCATPRRAKIVCTLGPASRSPAVIAELIEAGMDVARLNFSHGSHEDHARVVAVVREAAERSGRAIAVLQDLQGPKIRVGTLACGPVELVAGAEFTITTRPVPGSRELVSTTYAGLPEDVRPGGVLLIDDGLIQLRVKSVGRSDVVCEVIDGGLLKDHKGLNLPGTRVSAPSLTEKDKADLSFGLELGVDFVALSFVRRPEDLADVRAIVQSAGKRVPVIAKLEKPEALDCLPKLLEAVDGVMVARGDLGVELPPECVPVAQKRIIASAHAARVPVITATQMLESMTENPRPTRAEASDVANAIFDGTDATMLSAETASGKHPVAAVRMMDRIARMAEREPRLFVRHPPVGEGMAQDFAQATCLAACDAARAVEARAIVAFTQTGNTARILSKLRPEPPIVAFTPDPGVRRMLALYWGVTPCLMPPTRSIDELIEKVDSLLLQNRFASPGDRVAVVMGTPFNRTGTTNLMKLHRVLSADV